ncbi:hypothetical protein BCV69DRAFT_283489 [Microstroma glucosiphilum]|uniref:Uncharacterized protein n=1 Tax=Pseudomicrostroma glucosiphilum TaxID=1684307 RepID=A0A316U3U1_9BASI|nr:hypothetical protein BCV69DRAFT_283489 [Pseudomicrostroma glucosiphilum]PWN19956.1 hypothetical protein BCV69DRAFT_283489 [Pseudomicrostroma glucosiphilum]
MASSSLFPPPLTLHFAPPAGSSISSGSGEEPIDQPPNLMPFSIEYTGPANVDGYLVSHQAAKKTSSSSATSSSSQHQQHAHSSLAGPSGVDIPQEEVYTHFRGRRLWRTTLPLPADWSGRVCLLQRERPRDAPVGARTGSSQTAMGEGADTVAGEVARRRLEQEEAAEREEMRRKKRRLNAAAAASSSSGRNGPAVKKPAAMATFSMDDDEDEVEDEDEGDMNGGAGLSEEEEADVYDLRDEEDPHDDDDHPQEDDFLPQDLPTAPSDTRSTAPPLPQSVTTTSLLPSSRFSTIHIWSPDGKLDAGDEELVKVLGEWRSINTLVSARGIA